MKDKRGGYPKRYRISWKYSRYVRITLLMALALLLSCKPLEIDAAKNGVSWTVTQYGKKDSTRQSMFYSIKGSDGRVIIIDGGWKEDECHVRKAISRLGSQVDLWIITHPHPDHVGAFNAIMETGDLKIKEIWAPKIKVPIYKKYQKPWDEYPIYQGFRRLMSKRSTMTWIKAGQEIPFYGLDFEFFNSYSYSIPKQTEDICNGSSLVFKVSGKEDSMLFTGDMDPKVGKALVKKYGERLQADYLQMPHHGNNRGRYPFFHVVDAKKVFVDAPSFLLGYPMVKANLSYFKKKDIKIFTYRSSGYNKVGIQ